jgi:polar amino acid transport system substrate-binding protein
MKKIILVLTIILAASLMIGSASAEGFFDIFGDSASDDVNNDTNFVVGFNPEFPPFTYKDAEGNYTGFDLELAREVAKRNNWTFVAQPIIDWNSKEVELNSNEIDCIWSEFTINGRESDYEWSDIYFNNSQVIIVKSDSGINSPDDLKGKNVEVQEGSSALQTLNEQNESLKNTFAQLTLIKEYNTGFMDLESGVCDAIIGDVGIANYHLNEKFSDSNIKILDEPLSYEQYGIGFKKGNTELKDQVQKTLDEMFEDGTVDKIAQKYDAYGIPESLVHD